MGVLVRKSRPTGAVSRTYIWGGIFPCVRPPRTDALDRSDTVSLRRLGVTLDFEGYRTHIHSLGYLPTKEGAFRGQRE